MKDLDNWPSCAWHHVSRVLAAPVNGGSGPPSNCLRIRGLSAAASARVSSPKPATQGAPAALIAMVLLRCHFDNLVLVFIVTVAHNANFGAIGETVRHC